MIISVWFLLRMRYISDKVILKKYRRDGQATDDNVIRPKATDTHSEYVIKKSRLRPRIFSTFGTTRVVGRRPNAPAAFTPEEIPGTHFQRLSRLQGTWFCRKKPRKKSQVKPPVIDPGTVNYYSTPDPLWICDTSCFSTAILVMRTRFNITFVRGLCCSYVNIFLCNFRCKWEHHIKQSGGEEEVLWQL